MYPLYPNLKLNLGTEVNINKTTSNPKIKPRLTYNPSSRHLFMCGPTLVKDTNFMLGWSYIHSPSLRILLRTNFQYRNHGANMTGVKVRQHFSDSSWIDINLDMVNKVKFTPFNLKHQHSFLTFSLNKVYTAQTTMFLSWIFGDVIQKHKVLCKLNPKNTELSLQQKSKFEQLNLTHSLTVGFEADRGSGSTYLSRSMFKWRWSSSSGFALYFGLEYSKQGYQILLGFKNAGMKILFPIVATNISQED
mmetsp:Transcript_9008/g.13776  ORF Transcript_9008/g.13776 Transcript_9008/m.13776 type:complete len:248 (-) Transcript_9008:715-1458(-)